MHEADSASQKAKYEMAIKRYVSALVICPRNVKTIAHRIEAVFQKVDALKQEAFRQQQKLKVQKSIIETALKEAETHKKLAKENEQKANENLAKANKLINTFYFYDDKYALAYGENEDHKNVFYFIDKNGDRVEKLREWKKAEQFTDIGFAKVWDDKNIEYYLDTDGNSYAVAYSLAEMDSSKTALDLSYAQTGQVLATFPKEILHQTQLQILIMSGNYSKRNTFQSLPQKINDLQKLKVLQINYSILDSLTPSIGQLKNLTSLDLSFNDLESLP